jgi:hypothetical protein
MDFLLHRSRGDEKPRARAVDPLSLHQGSFRTDAASCVLTKLETHRSQGCHPPKFKSTVILTASTMLGLSIHLLITQAPGPSAGHTEELGCEN